MNSTSIRWVTLNAGALPWKPKFSLRLFAAIHRVKRKEDLANLAPQQCLVPTEAVKGEVRQVGEKQIATR